VLLLYATGLYFSTQQAENDESPCMTANILNNKKYLQVLNKALDALAQFFCFTNGRSIPLCGLTKDSNYSQPNGDISFVAYLDSLEFLCKMLLQPANAFWKLFSDGKEVHYSGDTDFILTALHQFSDSSLAAYR
jgi:separase